MAEDKKKGTPIKYPNGKHPNSHQHYWGPERKYEKPRYVSFWTEEIMNKRLEEEAQRRQTSKSQVINELLKILPKTKAERENEI